TSFRWEASSLTDGDGHGTHVCGIMCSADATFRGMAWGADTVSVYATSSESTSMVGLNWLMTNVTERAEDVNHSFGYGQANGTDYRNTDQFFDGACDNFSFLVSKSNGNNGYGTTTLTHPAPAYNLIAVASMNDFGTATRNDDRVSSFSSSGPTLAGRKKPDLAAPGEGITSTYRTGGFTSLSGTSMAAPHAGGSVVLLMGLGCPSPMAAKAVLINNADAMNSNNTASTADDSFVNGSRWDKAYGWGYINLSKAYLHAPDVFERTLPAPPNGGRSFKLFKGQMFTNDKASVTWNRHLVYNGASYPTIVRQLSNLDLLAYNAATNAQTGASTSVIDNVEQLSVGADAMTVVKVQSQGNFDPNVPTERFALATEENFVEASGPITAATWFKLPGSTYTAPFNLTVTVTNTGDLPVFNAQGLLENYIVVSGQNPAPIGTLLPGQSIQLNWVVRRGITTGITYAKTTVTGVGFGENWSWVLQDPNPL
ncbi:MAG: S8 family serine peptidase, partial [Chthonomonadaceae bacterium]|nr:S8 family serine peptidase [Chthonomonadaceae bacterium]